MLRTGSLLDKDKLEAQVCPEGRFRRSFPRWLSGTEPACQAQETRIRSLGPEDPLEEGMAIDSRILAWRIPWTEEPGGLQSTGLPRVGHA